MTFTQKNFVGVSLEDGKLLWRRPYTTPSTTTSQTPILYKDMVIEMGRGNGVTAFRVAPGSGEWATNERLAHRRGLGAHERRRRRSTACSSACRI